VVAADAIRHVDDAGLVVPEVGVLVMVLEVAGYDTTVAHPRRRPTGWGVGAPLLCFPCACCGSRTTTKLAISSDSSAVDAGGTR
jgi:hypothetical protein